MEWHLGSAQGEWVLSNLGLIYKVNIFQKLHILRLKIICPSVTHTTEMLRDMPEEFLDGNSDLWEGIKILEIVSRACRSLQIFSFLEKNRMVVQQMKMYCGICNVWIKHTILDKRVN